WMMDINNPQKPPLNVRYEPCNTAFCLAGHIWFQREIDNGVNPKDIKLPEDNFDPMINGGADYLGIGYGEASDLFLMNGEEQRTAFDALPNDKRATLAIKMLEHLRDTGSADWDAVFSDYDADDYDDD